MSAAAAISFVPLPEGQQTCPLLDSQTSNITTQTQEEINVEVDGVVALISLARRASAEQIPPEQQASRPSKGTPKQRSGSAAQSTTNDPAPWSTKVYRVMPRALLASHHCRIKSIITVSGRSFIIVDVTNHAGALRDVLEARKQGVADKSKAIIEKALVYIYSKFGVEGAHQVSWKEDDEYSTAWNTVRQAITRSSIKPGHPESTTRGMSLLTEGEWHIEMPEDVTTLPELAQKVTQAFGEHFTVHTGAALPTTESKTQPASLSTQMEDSTTTEYESASTQEDDANQTPYGGDSVNTASPEEDVLSVLNEMVGDYEEEACKEEKEEEEEGQDTWMEESHSSLQEAQADAQYQPCDTAMPGNIDSAGFADDCLVSMYDVHEDEESPPYEDCDFESCMCGF